MKKKNKVFIKILAIFILAPLIAWSFASSAAGQPAKKGTPAQKASVTKDIYPGINAPWTEPKKVNFKGSITIGDVSDYTGAAGKTCFPIATAIQDWFRYVNEYLGGIEGYKILVDSVDTKYDPQNNINSVSRFIDEGKIILYSPVAGTFPATVEIITRRKVPMIAPSGTVTFIYLTPEQASKRDNYFFSSSPVVASRMEIYVKFFMEDWKKKGKAGAPVFGTLNFDNQLGHEAATAARMFITKHGAKFGVHTFCLPSISDARAQVTALKNAKVDYIISGPISDQPVTVFALELYRQKTSDWAPIYGSHTDFGTSYLDTKNIAFEGHYSYQYTLDWYDTEAPIIKWVHDINKRWHPDVVTRPLSYNFGIQGAIVITEALKRGIKKYGDPKKLDGEKMRQILETFDKFDPLGISGPITYNRYDHQGSSALRIAENKDKRLVPATGWIQADPLTGEQRDGKYWLKD